MNDPTPGVRAGRRLAPALVAPFLLLAAAVAYAVTTFLVVSPTNLQGWQIQRSTSGVTPTPTPTPDVLFVTGPATPPLGTGSAEFRMGPDGGGAAQLRHPGYAGTRLPNPSATATPAANELSSLSYATFTQQDGSGGQAPYIILQIDTDGDAGIEDLLFFEPVYQSATFCPSNPQPAFVVGQWQTWDAFNGCWYSVFGTAGSGPGTNTVSLRTLSAALPMGQIANSSPSGLGGVRIVTGFGAGAWDNYVGNADAFRIGVGANDTGYNFDPNETPPTVGPPATLIISEARLRGANGLEDEFVEVYNNSGAAHVVSPPDGSGGYALAGSDGVVRGTIPFGTVIPARGHYLFANSDGYSLSGYAAPDATYTTDLPNDGTGGVALFTTDNPANMTLANRFDALGFNGAPALYREGAGHPAAGFDVDAEASLVRKVPATTPQDTNNNAADFAFVSTSAATVGGVQTTLGAPGPEGLASPVERSAQFGGFNLDGTKSTAAAPNRERDFTSDPGNNSTFGTLTIRRRMVNNTGAPVTRLRFRVTAITGFPVQGSSIADLRVRTSADTTVSNVDDPTTCAAEGLTPPCAVTVRGLTLEVPPAQPDGGGLNSSLALTAVTAAPAASKGAVAAEAGEGSYSSGGGPATSDTIALGAPLANGASINLQFLLGIQKTGNFRFYVIVETLP